MKLYHVLIASVTASIVGCASSPPVNAPSSSAPSTATKPYCDSPAPGSNQNQCVIELAIQGQSIVVSPGTVRIFVNPQDNYAVVWRAPQGLGFLDGDVTRLPSALFAPGCATTAQDKCDRPTGGKPAPMYRVELVVRAKPKTKQEYDYDIALHTGDAVVRADPTIVIQGRNLE
jgi:hypothetical protein